MLAWQSHDEVHRSLFPHLMTAMVRNPHCGSLILVAAIVMKGVLTVGVGAGLPRSGAVLGAASADARASTTAAVEAPPEDISHNATASAGRTWDMGVLWILVASLLTTTRRKLKLYRCIPSARRAAPLRITWRTARSSRHTRLWIFCAPYFAIKR